MSVPNGIIVLMDRKTWTKIQLKEAVKVSYSYRQVLNKLNLKAAGGNYVQLKKYIKEYNFDVSHFKGKGWNRGLQFLFTPKIPIEKILVKGNNFQSYKLKNRLIKEGFKKPQCEECGWAQKSFDGRLPLELHHIDGDSHNNSLSNLQILCPNCHSLKPNYRGCKK
ncbi:MAG: HNH endonuclease signature motif containing protein [Minisyncoccales bacterium]